MVVTSLHSMDVKYVLLYIVTHLLMLCVASNVMSMLDFYSRCRYEYHYLQATCMITGYCFTTNLV